jgi:GTP-binding protein
MQIHDIKFVLGAASWAGLPKDGRPEVAFIGRSNVGKSSLLNYLVGRRALARTSGTPGKTQEFNYFLVNDSFYLVDLPGFGYAKIARAQREKWARLIGRFVRERESLGAVVQLIDSRHPPSALAEAMVLLMNDAPPPLIIALTKGDKLSKNQQQQSVAAMKQFLQERHMDAPVVLTSAEKKQGADEIWQWVRTLAGVKV